jgi:hypothetical protein
LRISQSTGGGSHLAARRVKWDASVAHRECDRPIFKTALNTQLQADRCGKRSSAAMAKNVG